jgi:6-phosphofructokinase 1
MTMATFGILCGGGPAPGLNGVIGAAVTRAARAGGRTLGLYDGFKWIMEGDSAHAQELRAEDVALIHLEGGSVLRTSRANPTKKPESLANCVKALGALGIDHLITIGGDDTAFSARRVAEQAGGKLQVAHVPKTIDNDLPLPGGIPTFGFETARDLGASVIERIQEDCRTTNRWFLIVMMGRKAGHLALGTGKSAGAAITLIPEEFPPGPIRFTDVVRLVEGAIVKRLAAGRPDGVAVVAEGLVERMEPSDLEHLKDVARDEHGHIRLADVPFGRVLREALAESLGGRGVKVALGDKDVGYELRCGRPTAFDRDYTRDLGVGAVEALLAGRSSVLVTRQESGRIVPIPFDELMDPKTGKTKVRYVDVSTDSFKSARALQTRVEQADLDDPKRLAALAKAANLSESEVRTRYAPI